MKILAISGALRKGSTNTALLHTVKKLAPEGIEIEIVTLHGIPLYDGDLEADKGIPDSVLKLKERIRAADAVIIATPEYNFSIPGVLKNATDWLSRDGNPFKWKRVGVMGASGGPIGTARSQYHLRQNLQALEAIVMPKPEVFVTNSASKFDEKGDLNDEPTRKVIETWLKHFKEWVENKP
ncbi:MAG: NADPH-dependent FMN reductase [Hyphomicrobiales bacterium]